MAINRATRYPGRYKAPDAGQPEGAFKNKTAPAAEDGSYFEEDWANDWAAFFSSLLEEAGIATNQVIDEVGSSQLYDAFKSVIANNLLDVDLDGSVEVYNLLRNDNGGVEYGIDASANFQIIQTDDAGVAEQTWLTGTRDDGLTVHDTFTVDDPGGNLLLLRSGAGGTLSAITGSGVYRFYTSDDTGGDLSQAIEANHHGNTVLFYDGGDRLETTSTGVNVAGVINSTNEQIITASGTGTYSHTALNDNGGVSFAVHSVNSEMRLFQTSSSGLLEKTWVQGLRDGATQLYYNGTAKLQTSSTGATTTGAHSVSTKFITSAGPTTAQRVLDWSGLGIIAWGFVNSQGTYVAGRGVSSTSNPATGEYIINTTFSGVTGSSINVSPDLELVDSYANCQTHRLSSTQYRVRWRNAGGGDLVCGTVFFIFG